MVEFQALCGSTRIGRGQDCIRAANLLLKLEGKSTLTEGDRRAIEEVANRLRSLLGLEGVFGPDLFMGLETQALTSLHLLTERVSGPCLHTLPDSARSYG